MCKKPDINVHVVASFHTSEMVILIAVVSWSSSGSDKSSVRGRVLQNVAKKVNSTLCAKELAVI